MKQYIDKVDIMAEIKKRIKEIDEIGTYLSPKGVLTNLLCHLNATEVKEVDLEKEFDNYTKNISAYDIKYEPFTHLYNCAKYFFELGLNIQKGE